MLSSYTGIIIATMLEKRTELDARCDNKHIIKHKPNMHCEKTENVSLHYSHFCFLRISTQKCIIDAAY